LLDAGNWRCVALLELGRGADFMHQVRVCSRRAEELTSAHLGYAPKMWEGACSVLARIAHQRK
jgi:hypothetical protein